MSGLRIGVDVGGTFTDVAHFGELDGEVSILKIQSTPDDPGRAVADGVTAASAGRSIVALVHGTTVATNVLLQGRAPAVALLVTKGFRDVLEIGRQERPRMYDLMSQRPEPLAPRRLRFEIAERMTYLGTVSSALDEDDLHRVATELRTSGVTSAAVCFLHSYANPAHEQRVKELLTVLTPEIEITLSSDLLKTFKEFERTSTTVANAYVRPPVRRYLERLGEKLEAHGVSEFQVMQSNAGMMTRAAAERQPILTVLSGPAAGALAGAQTARSAGHLNAISVDMGGTSFDISVAVAGGLAFTSEAEIAGHTICVPQVDIHTLGAGGGSIAWIDPAGGLQVGPESAGAVPGPAAYGRPGSRPTVTDANIALGRFAGRGLLGGQVAVDQDLACAAIERVVAIPLGLAVDEAAQGILDVVNASMARGIRFMSVERGHDPRDFVLVAFGGGGPAHAVELASQLGIQTVIIPRHPGLHSALGLLTADFRHDYVTTVMERPDDLGRERIDFEFRQLESRAAARMLGDGIPAEDFRLDRSVDVRYVGQDATLPVPFSPDLAVVRDLFDNQHKRLYGFSNSGEAVEFVNLRLVATGTTVKPFGANGDRGAATRAIGGSQAPTIDTRLVRFNGAVCTTRIIDRADLAPGNEFEGPAICVQIDSTTVVPPSWRVLVDINHNFIITRG